jgi:hypothetical protein
MKVFRKSGEYITILFSFILLCFHFSFFYSIYFSFVVFLLLFTPICFPLVFGFFWAEGGWGAGPPIPQTALVRILPSLRRRQDLSSFVCRWVEIAPCFLINFVEFIQPTLR